MLVNDAGAAEAAAAAAGDAAGGAGMDGSWEDRWDEPGAWDVVMKDLRRLKWADERVFELMLERYGRQGLISSRLVLPTCLSSLSAGLPASSHLPP